MLVPQVSHIVEQSLQNNGIEVSISGQHDLMELKWSCVYRHPSSNDWSTPRYYTSANSVRRWLVAVATIARRRDAA